MLRKLTQNKQLCKEVLVPTEEVVQYGFQHGFQLGATIGQGDKTPSEQIVKTPDPSFAPSLLHLSQWAWLTSTSTSGPNSC